MTYYTLNDLKTEARSKGYNLDTLPWRKCDWPIADQFLQYEKRINISYSQLLRDISANSPSALDTIARFDYVDSELGSYQYVKVKIQAGLRLGQTETVTFDGNVQVENDQGNYSPGSSISITYDKPFIEISVRYYKSGSNKFIVSSPSFSSTFIDGSQEAPASKQTICGNFICGQANVGFTL